MQNLWPVSGEKGERGGGQSDPPTGHFLLNSSKPVLHIQYAKVPYFSVVGPGPPYK